MNRFMIAVAVLTFFGCDEVKMEQEFFLEGHEIPNTRVFVPLGSYPHESRPAISPDGQWVAFGFIDTIPQAQGLYIMNFTTHEKTLLVNDITAHAPDWSPDGGWIVFNINSWIYKIKTNGDSLIQLTTAGSNFFPEWSPDGNKIAYDNTDCSSGGCGIFVMDSDGSEKHRIFSGREPDWQKKSNKIISWQGFDQSIWKKFIVYDVLAQDTIVLDGFRGGNNQNPQYSPDGDRILFQNEAGIWVMNSDGANPRRILPNDYFNSEPLGNGETRLATFSASWHPNGDRIIYEHFLITDYQNPNDSWGPFYEGYFSFYLLDVDSALTMSNLE
jgi:Tol biopolymer transport system component